jgi:hypothetical protein
MAPLAAQSVVLRTKAFSSDVWRVTFNAHVPGLLTTSGQGTGAERRRCKCIPAQAGAPPRACSCPNALPDHAGHIRFWKMAATFTGLKLQGQIGKFGRTELSDITGYAEFPDGKVLSGMPHRCPAPSCLAAAA